MMDSVLKMMNSVLKMMDSVLKMMDFHPGSFRVGSGLINNPGAKFMILHNENDGFMLNKMTF